MDCHVHCACVDTEMLALGASDARGVRHELFVMDTESGRQLLPTTTLAARAVELCLASGCQALLALDAMGTVSVWQLTGGRAVRRVAVAAPPLQEHPLEVGFLPSSCTPFLRLADSRVVAFHAGLRAWLALDVWRYAASPLQCRMQLPCPRHGPLYEKLWQWRRPKLPPDWLGCLSSSAPGGADSTGTAGLVRCLGHLERKAQLCHELAAMTALGTGAEVLSALAELASYCTEAGVEATAAELRELWPGRRPRAPAAELLARGLERQGIRPAEDLGRLEQLWAGVVEVL